MDLDSILRLISIAAIPFITAITLHEVAHGLVARRLGDRTAEAQGRLSLNPLTHVDVFGTIVLPALLLLARAPFLFGYAKPVPVVTRNLRNPHRDMAVVAAAGPASNVAMAFGWALLGTLAANGLFGRSAVGQWLLQMGEFGIRINALLAVFNLLPIPPFDGGRIVVGLLPPRAGEVLSRVEPFAMIGVLAIMWLLPGLFGSLIGPPTQLLIAAISSVFA